MGLYRVYIDVVDNHDIAHTDDSNQPANMMQQVVCTQGYGETIE